MDVEPRISVIIPAWNAERRIATCLDAIAAQTASADLFEVIVVDNASTDRTGEVAGRYSFVRLLHEPLPGSYRARNRALAVARGEHVLFTDADCVSDPDWIAVALDRIGRHPEVGVHAGRITLFRESKAGPFSALYEELVPFNQEGNVAWGFCVTANWLSRRDALHAIGGFNEAMMSGGDVDCSRRMVAAGHKLAYAADMVVGHPTRASIGQLIRKRRRVVGGRWALEQWAAGPMREPMRLLFNEALNEARWIKASPMEWWAKPGVGGVAVGQMLAAQLELLRLKAGRPAYRS